MSDQVKELTAEELEKVGGGVVMHFPDGWYVCSDDKTRRQIFGPYESEDRAWRVAADYGYEYCTISGPVFAPAKEK